MAPDRLYVPAERDGYGELTLPVEFDADGDVAGIRALYGGRIGVSCAVECGAEFLL